MHIFKANKHAAANHIPTHKIHPAVVDAKYADQNKPEMHLTKKFKNIFRAVYELLPRKYMSVIDEESLYAGLEEAPYKVVAISVLLSLASSLIVLATFGFLGYTVLFRLLISAILLMMGLFVPYIILTLMAESRRKEIETILPDMLLLTSSNVKSGLTIDKALLFSARPEFGILGIEVKHLALQIFGGTTLEDAFNALLKKVRSPILSRTVNLLLEGLRSGGAVAQLLEESATDIRNTEILQKEIRSSVLSYVIFIFMAAVLAAPFLFAVSTFLVTTTSQIWGATDFSVDDTEFVGGGFITISAPKINLDAFNAFVVFAILMTTVFASVLISLIQTGKFSQSFRYLPVFVIIGLVIFFATKSVLVATFGNLVGL